jgi:hypothetical protein
MLSERPHVEADALIKGDTIAHPDTGAMVTVAWTEIQSNGVVRVVLDRPDGVTEGDHPFFEAIVGEPVTPLIG